MPARTFQYLLLKILALLNAEWWAGLKIHVRLDEVIVAHVHYNYRERDIDFLKCI
jgi:hypothetical protein